MPEYVTHFKKPWEKELKIAVENLNARNITIAHFVEMLDCIIASEVVKRTDMTKRTLRKLYKEPIVRLPEYEDEGA